MPGVLAAFFLLTVPLSPPGIGLACPPASEPVVLDLRSSHAGGLKPPVQRLRECQPSSVPKLSALDQAPAASSQGTSSTKPNNQVGKARPYDAKLVAGLVTEALTHGNAQRGAEVF